jgi:hypothetical protein
MPNYVVTIPFAGSVSVNVEADDPDAAKAAAWERAGFRIVMDYPDEADANDCEMFDEMCRGNVCGAPCRSIDVMEE